MKKFKCVLCGCEVKGIIAIFIPFILSASIALAQQANDPIVGQWILSLKNGKNPRQMNIKDNGLIDFNDNGKLMTKYWASLGTNTYLLSDVKGEKGSGGWNVVHFPTVNGVAICDNWDKGPNSCILRRVPSDTPPKVSTEPSAGNAKSPEPPKDVATSPVTTNAPALKSEAAAGNPNTPEQPKSSSTSSVSTNAPAKPKIEASILGNWNVVLSNKGQPKFEFLEGGVVLKTERHMRDGHLEKGKSLKGQWKKEMNAILVDMNTDEVWKWKPIGENNWDIEVYAPKNRYPLGKPVVTGIGKK